MQSGDDKAAKPPPRLHGRVERGAPCDAAGCAEPGEFRAPPDGGRARAGYDGPGDWRWLCLDHVRAFNASYNFFEGMSTDEIEAAQTPFGGWERETRAFAGAAPQPRWAFTDPIDAPGFGQGFGRAGSPRNPHSEGDRRALSVLALPADADLQMLRKRYALLVRRYHPDRNGGDRAHEKALQDVIAAYTHLKRRLGHARSA